MTFLSRALFSLTVATRRTSSDDSATATFALSAALASNSFAMWSLAPRPLPPRIMHANDVAEAAASAARAVSTCFLFASSMPSEAKVVAKIQSVWKLTIITTNPPSTIHQNKCLANRKEEQIVVYIPARLSSRSVPPQPASSTPQSEASSSNHQSQKDQEMQSRNSSDGLVPLPLNADGAVGSGTSTRDLENSLQKAQENFIKSQIEMLQIQLQMVQRGAAGPPSNENTEHTEE
ncbi:hypothetical protein ZEAMMB73_Zm00001d052565 [Zea mays]|uniref:Uncharacterized protein n=1 Tax=Zea mays TaxID=4577 RepID=A0A1D6QHT1_MAIZE|nr:hypothetical protein ZEAMMB73_Zm00001d052565 [Zea mays]